MDETTVTISDQAADTVVESDELLDEELLVEEISIDGMCGVY
ncbi:mycofactocin precursor MftA [Ilumatobacter nonamiensis]|nr:mycofactocin precursor MftA [Ilumatobacter nonamiensis]